MRGLHSADPQCQICTHPEGLRVVAGHEFGDRVPAAYPNPEDEHGQWFHGTSYDPKHGDLKTPEERGENHSGWRHWNTHLGTHFTSIHDTASEFATRAAGSHARIAHASLHMESPMHYPSEYHMTDDAFRWARKNGFRDYDQERGKPKVEFDESPEDHHWLNKNLLSDRGIADDWIRGHPRVGELAKGFKEHLQGQGFDGITYGNEHEKPIGHTSAIAFKETPVKVNQWEKIHAPADRRVASVRWPEELPHEELHHYVKGYPDFPEYNGIKFRYVKSHPIAHISEPMSPEDLSLSEKDGNMDARGHHELAHALKHNPDSVPPIIIANPHGIIDGGHRAALALHQGISHLHAYVGDASHVDHGQPGSYWKREAMGMEGPDYDNLRFKKTVDDDEEGDPDAARSHGDFAIHAIHPEHGVVGKLTYEDAQHPEWTGYPERALHINMLRVHPEHRRRGIATQLMNHLEATHPDVPIDHGTRTRMGEAWGRHQYGRESKPSTDFMHGMGWDDAAGKETPTHYEADWTLNGKPWNIKTKKHLRRNIKRSSLNVPHSRAELINHAEGSQTLYKPHGESMYAGLCAAHALQHEKERQTQFSDVGIDGMDEHTPERRWESVGQGSCGTCTRHQNESINRLPGGPSERLDGPRRSPESRPHSFNPDRQVPFDPSKFHGLAPSTGSAHEPLPDILYKGVSPLSLKGIQEHGLRPSEMGESGPGTYLTRDHEYAKKYSFPDLGGAILHVRHKVTNPLRRNLDDPDDPGDKEYRHIQNMTPGGTINTGGALGHALRERGYDSVETNWRGRHEIAVHDPSKLEIVHVEHTRQAVRRTATDEYRMNHRPGAPDDEVSAPAHALDQVYPKDVYEKPHFYGGGEGLYGGRKAFSETVHTLRHIRGNPEAPVTMYRALPPEHAHKGFGTGDWVSVHGDYARGHGLHPEDEKEDWPVIKATVPAKHLWNNGDSLDEFGYHGPPVKGEIHFPGGENAAKRLHKQAATKMVRPSEVWDHIRTDVRPHRLDTIRDSVAEHGWQPEWNVADGPIKVTLDPPAVSNGSHRLHVLREMGRDDPIPMQVSGKTASTYTVRLEHGTRRKPGEYEVPNNGPVTPAYLQHPTNVSHVKVHVEPYDEHGNQRPWSEMDNEARQTATHMSTAPGDMVTKADIIHLEAAKDAEGWKHGHCEPGMKCKDMTLPTSYLMKGNQYVSDDDDGESPENEHNWRRAWRYSEQMKKSDAWHSPDWDPEPHTDPAFRDSPGQVHVHVNKKGQPSLLDGNHRTMAAEIADIDEIPNVHVTAHPDGIARLPHRKQATRFTPDKRVFTHTCGLDHRLFEADGHLKPDVRKYIMSSVQHILFASHDWSKWAIVYFAGSEASEWTSDTLEGNNDFDVLIGVDYQGFRRANPQFAHVSSQAITELFNQGFRPHNGPVMLTIDGKSYGPFDRTTYVNHDSYAIEKIKPYAAYNVSEDKWAVKPPHLPHWSLSELPRAVQMVLRSASNYAHHVLKLPEPERTQQGAALFDSWHSDRSRAFSDKGEGWWDIANLREKWLDQSGIWSELVNCKHRSNQGLDATPADWSNEAPYGLHDTASRTVYASNQEITERLLGVESESQHQEWIRPVQHVANRHRDSSRLGLQEPQSRNSPGNDSGAYLSHAGSVVSGWDQLPPQDLREPGPSRASLPKRERQARQEDSSATRQDPLPAGSRVHPREYDDLQRYAFVSDMQPGAQAEVAPKFGMGQAGPDYQGLHFKYWKNYSSQHDAPHWLDGNDKHDRRSFFGMMAFRPGEHESVGSLEFSPLHYGEGDREVHVHGIKVNPEHQRRGVGSALLKELERHYPDAPIHHGLRTQQGADLTEHVYGQPSPKSEHPGHSEQYGDAPYEGGWTLGGKPYKKATLVVEHRHWGGGLESLFPSDEDGPKPTAQTPWQAAGQRKDVHTYDKDLVARSITHPHEFSTEDVDPRDLRATQPKVVRAGVKHYMDNPDAKSDDPRLGNDTPRIYHREDGQKIILSGHHRAAAALLKGEKLRAIVIHGGWGHARNAA